MWPETEVDHIDGDGLNNRLENLRLATTTNNNRNQRKRTGRTYSSQYKGVSYRQDRDTWLAAIGVDYKRVKLGTYPTEEEAAKAYDVAALQFFGEFARLNFPK
jgi:hypothetical protein